MSEKRYRMQTACPQCGCSQVIAMSDQEIKDRFGDVPNVELNCGECMAKYEKPMAEACPEWDKACKAEKA